MSEVTNRQRADWAGEAVQTFKRATGLDRSGDDDETALHDLIVDLRHWCDSKGLDFDGKCEASQAAYHQELNEEKAALAARRPEPKEIFIRIEQTEVYQYRMPPDFLGGEDLTRDAVENWFCNLDDPAGEICDGYHVVCRQIEAADQAGNDLLEDE